MADGNTQEVPVEARPGAPAQPIGVTSEEAHIKLSSLVSDLLGVSARHMLKALADGETNPAALAALAHQKLRATPEQLCDALGACTDLKPVYRRLLKMALDQLQFLEQQIGQLDSATDHCRSWSHRGDLSVGGTAFFMGGRLPRRRTERRRELQPPISEGQPPPAAHSQPNGQRCNEDERKHLRHCVSPLGHAPGT